MHLLVLFLIIDTQVKMERMEKIKSRKSVSTTNSHTKRQEKYCRTKMEFLVFAIYQGDQIKIQDLG